MQPPGPGRVDRLCGLPVRVPVAVPAADALVPAGAEGPAAVPGGRPVAGEQHAADVAAHPGVVQRRVELIHGVRAERVPDLGPVEGHPDRAAAGGTVVGDVGELKARDGLPAAGIEYLRDHGLILADGLRAGRSG